MNVKECLELYNKDMDHQALLELFLKEFRENSISLKNNNLKAAIPKEDLNLISFLDEKWREIAEKTKSMKKSLNKNSFSVSIEVYYTSLYRKWKDLRKDEIIW